MLDVSPLRDYFMKVNLISLYMYVRNRLHLIVSSPSFGQSKNPQYRVFYFRVQRRSAAKEGCSFSDSISSKGRNEVGEIFNLFFQYL